MNMLKPNEVERLGEELFSMIEAHQGHFHHADGGYQKTKAELLGCLRWRLEHGKEAVRIMEAFIKKHEATP